MKMDMRDGLLVAGTGIAGLSAAMNAKEKNPEIEVLCITSGTLKDNSSSLAQGGIACALGKNDCWKMHLEDTLIAGRGLSGKQAATVLVK